jgi:hypothetical protein
VKDLAKQDPFELVGVVDPAGVTEEADRETARCIIEEFAITGFSAHDIGDLFTSPIYGLPHAIFRRRGELFVRELISGVFGARR